MVDPMPIVNSIYIVDSITPPPCVVPFATAFAVGLKSHFLLFSTLFILLGVLVFALLTWLVGIVAYVQMKKRREEEGEWSRRNRQDYFRFQ